MPDPPAQPPVAIIGMGCRFPGGANTPEQLWQMLCQGVDAIGEIPRDRFDVDALFDPDPAAPGKIYTRWGGYLEGIDEFDAGFFGIAPREVRRMDPQQRLLLEVAWEALEHGGQPPDLLAGTSTGVFVGVAGHDYADIQALALNRHGIDAHVNVGSSGCIIANRLSYLLDLHGPSFTVDTACSSSLTAVHLACRSLAAGECDLAIAGGVNVLLAPEPTIGFCKANMLSPDGRCRSFDAGANGYVRSEGVGAVVLKPLAAAIADHDPIQAVIRGSAINQDGRTAGLSLPNVAGQEEMLRRALRDAGVAASAVGYVEAHGTGTTAGDPVEAAALGAVLSEGRPVGDTCLIGSVKSNIGHLEVAAGVAGLIKAALAVRHRAVPPNLHFVEPNPAIDFDGLQLRVPTQLEPWPTAAGPAVAGVNSFGFGGANAHLVLEEPPRATAEASRPSSGPGHVLTLSAHAPEALRQSAERHLARLRGAGPVDAHDLCYTAATRRTHHQHRLAAVFESQEELFEQLEAFCRGEQRAGLAVGRHQANREPRLAFVFSGMGPQWWGMGQQLWDHEPMFRDALEECDDVLQPLTGWSLVEELATGEHQSRIGETDVAQVVNCAVQIALAALWRSWGVVPDAVVGHSAGEMAAAHVAGALSLPDALFGAYHRGRLLARATGTGTMLAAGVSEEEAAELIAGHGGRVCIAAVNSPTSVTLSGEAAPLEQIARALEAQERFCRRLPVDVPYHGPQMEAIREELLDVLAGLSPAHPTIPIVAGSTGTWADGGHFGGDHWWRNVRQPVRFAAAVDTLLEDGAELIVEVSPHPVLASSIAECLASRGTTGTVLPTLRRQEGERRVMLGSLATLYAHGRRVDWQGLYPTGSCITLPAYPWQRERHWFEADGAAADLRPVGVDTGHPLLGRRLPSPQPSWEADLEDPRADYLDDHVVEDSAVFPGAAYVEMALAAGLELWGDRPVVLEQVKFHKLLFLTRPRDLRLQLHYSARDSSVEMHSAPASEPLSWTLNCAATLRPGEERAADEGFDLGQARARCASPTSSEEQYRSLEARGFRYGAPFRGLRQIWSAESEAVGRISFPDGVDLRSDGYRVHPALLDAAFQLFGLPWSPSSIEAHAGRPLFPVSVDRIELRRAAGSTFWAHLALRHAGDGLLEGDIRLVDDDGSVAIACEGLRIKVLEEGGSPGRREIDDWLYELRWEEAALPASPARPDGQARPSLRALPDISSMLHAQRAGPEAASGAQDYYDAVEPSLDRIAIGFALGALDELGWVADRDRDRPIDAVAEALGVVASHRRLLAGLVRMLPGAADRARGNGASLRHDRGALQRQLDELIGQYPAYAAKPRLVRKTGGHLADILRGRVDAREILLTDDSLRLLAQLYQASPLGRAYHEAVSDAVAAAIDGWPDGAPLRVLEIGAGTGAATAAVLPRLPATAEYVFTDISPHFLTRAQERFPERLGMRFAVLDIEADPAAQGFDPRSFDVVLAANVLHTTAALRATVANVGQLLAPGGLLGLLELTRPTAWFNLVFGLLDGWWRFADVDLRPHQPLLQAGQWRSLLEESGFDEVASLFEGEREGGELQTVVLARAPMADESAAGSAASAPARPRRWLLLADRGGVASSLAAALRARGDACTLAYRGEAFCRREDGVFELPVGDVAAASLRLLAELEREGGEALHGVVHAWSLDAGSGDDLGADALMEAQQLGAGSALEVVQALQRGQGRMPEAWLVTSGSQPVPGHDAAPHMAQAALWGLGRVLMSEHAEVRCRLVDLGPDPVQDEIDALAEELCGDAEDEELALRGERRLVRRLHRVALDHTARRQERHQLAPDGDGFSLSIKAPGALESLGLEQAPPAEPGPGELSIRVVASGLSFRDVLHSLGMLPAAAFQHESGPPSLGSECAGVVVACGEGVEGFRVGDEVIALASATHGSRAIARADLAVAKPPSLSFEAAACLPNAYVTADYALHHVARVAAGERVLIHSAAGAVGLAAIAYCRRAGAQVYATAGTPDKRAYLRSAGVEHVMDSRSLAFADEILERTGGEGVDVVLNSLAGEALLKGIAVLRPYGRFVELGKRDIYDNAQVGLLPFQRNLSFHAIDLVQLALDRPELAQSLLAGVVEDVSTGALPLIPHTAFDLAEAEAAFRLMAQAKHIGKVVLTVREPSYPVRTNRDVPIARADATYLITGGLGGFGLAVAEWLAHQGARHLVLLSRTGTPKEGAAALDRLRESGADVSIMRADVSQEGDVARVLDAIQRELPPLRGVVHAAMVLDDDVLVRLDRQRFDAVLAPKVAGAWSLHRLTREHQLDFFVLFSSMASVIGHPLQANYAAANAFLDSLAAHRHALDLPALTIGWGAVSDVGYVARHPETAQYLDRGGFTTFSPEQALDTLGQLLRYDLSHVIAARMDWSRWAASNSLTAASKRFERFVADALQGADERLERAPESPLTLLQGAAAAQRAGLLQGYVVQQVAKVLGTAPDKVDPERGLSQLGFDSLMAVELVTALKSDLAVSVPVVRILQGTSALELVDVVLDQLDLDDAPPATAADAQAPGQPQTGAEHPLSFEQRRFWFLQRLDPDDAAYNLPVAARLSGDLDRDALHRSLSEVLRRHELLRATVREVDGEPLQRFAPPSPAGLPVVDLADLAEPERQGRLSQLAMEEIQRPFDFDAGPLLRATLIRLGPKDHLLLLVVHHIACDAWAVNLVIRELAALYQAFSRGQPSPLPEPALGYIDYVRHQQARLDEVGDAQLAYWQRQLADAPLALGLADPPARPTAGATRGAHHHFELTAELTAELEALAKREGATLFMTLLAAFQTLLHRYTGAQDVCVGTAVSTRHEPGVDAVVGCFINTVALRSDLSGEPTFRELLGRVKQTTLDAFAHQDVPFDRVVEALGPERSPGGPPLFEAMLVLHNARSPELRVAGLDVRSEPVESGTTVGDLVLLLDTGPRLGGTLEYNADRFDTATVDRLLSHFRAVLQGVVADPEQRLSDVPLLSDAERHRVLVEWNDTAADLGPPACLHELVEDQVGRSPRAVAVVHGDEALTYTELDERANRLARHLRGLGVAPQAVVGVCLPRSTELVVAALAILKAGGAYLPLDPALPPERLRLMLADARPGVVLTRQSLLDALPRAQATVVALDVAWAEVARQRADKPAEAASPEGLAYMIYTSGSTGEPKGVAVPHRAICNQARWRQRAFPLSEADAVLQRTPLGFDPSVWELFGPLAAGARLVLPPEGAEASGRRLVQVLAEQRITVLQVVPSVLAALLEQPGLDDCRALRRVLCGGEALSPQLAERFTSRLPATLHNLYGPTETAIDATHWACGHADGQPVVPIGRPIANARVLILDDRLEPVPVGVPGELHIGGAGLALGYHDRPELTAQRFIEDPFLPGARLYRTGDLGRWLPDGAIAFLGRADRQVKVRGHRVEPGEVEAVLTGHPGVREAAVVAVEDGDGSHRLAAFVVAEQPATPDEVRRYAAERLPDPMVPRPVTLLGSLPRTASGKVDHADLAAQAALPPGRPGGTVAPRDSLERELLAIWEAFFPGRQVGVTDDFFALGGHSLLAMRVIARVERALGRQLPVSSLLDGRTIERLACLLREQSPPRSPLVPIQPHGTARPFFWVHPVGGTVYCYAELAAALGERRPIYGLEAAGLSGDEPHTRIEDMARHYVEQVAHAPGARPYLLGGWSMGGVIAFEMARQLEARGEPVALLAIVDAAPAGTTGDAGRADETEALRGLVEHLGLSLSDMTVPIDDFWAMSRHEQLSCVLEHARRAHLVPPDLELPALHQHLQVLTTNLEAMRSYEALPYGGHVTLLDAEESFGRTARHAARWEALALGGVTRHTVAGNHHTVLQPPHVAALADRLSACLEALDEVEPVPS